MRVTRHRRVRRLMVLLSLLAITAGLLLSPAYVLADPTPPPNPSNQQLNDANAAKTALADQVGTLSAQVASLQSQLVQLQGAAQLAEQKVARAEQQLQDANAAAAAAAAAVTAAQQQVTDARQRFTDFVRTTFMAGGLGGTAGQLLTASNPEQLLTEGDYVTFTADHQLDAIGSLDKATVVKSNADAAARGTVVAQQAATAAAAKAEQDARNAVASTQSQQNQVNATLATQQTALQTAQANLATLNGQRAAYDAYVAEQAAIAEAKAEAARVAKEQADAQAAAARRSAGSQGTGSGNGAAVAVAAVAVAPTGGRWSAAAGQTAVNRAMAYLGWPYSFAAGGTGGPSYGIAVDFDSRNDAHVYGFDCSGLTMYAWGPYLSMAHFAATQYFQAGSYHPSTSNLMPGDLVFWSGDGTESGIGHVAIYIGNGNVIQAPFSGAFIEITPLGQVESGYYGATRPLT